jgi:hypothetical protein
MQWIRVRATIAPPLQAVEGEGPFHCHWERDGVAVEMEISANGEVVIATGRFGTGEEAEQNGLRFLADSIRDALAHLSQGLGGQEEVKLVDVAAERREHEGKWIPTEDRVVAVHLVWHTRSATCRLTLRKTWKGSSLGRNVHL